MSTCIGPFSLIVFDDDLEVRYISRSVGAVWFSSTMSIMNYVMLVKDWTDIGMCTHGLDHDEVRFDVHSRILSVCNTSQCWTNDRLPV